jgi:hypothetical protein
MRGLHPCDTDCPADQDAHNIRSEIWSRIRRAQNQCSQAIGPNAINPWSMIKLGKFDAPRKYQGGQSQSRFVPAGTQQTNQEEDHRGPQRIASVFLQKGAEIQKAGSPEQAGNHRQHSCDEPMDSTDDEQLHTSSSKQAEKPAAGGIHLVTSISYRKYLDFHLRQPVILHAQLVGGTRRKIDDAPGDEWPAIIDPAFH